jgi:hypothetical protein
MRLVAINQMGDCGLLVISTTEDAFTPGVTDSSVKSIDILLSHLGLNPTNHENFMLS